METWPTSISLIKLGMTIIEDAAESIGSKYKNILSGNLE